MTLAQVTLDTLRHAGIIALPRDRGTMSTWRVADGSTVEIHNLAAAVTGASTLLVYSPPRTEREVGLTVTRRGNFEDLFPSFTVNSRYTLRGGQLSILDKPSDTARDITQRVAVWLGEHNTYYSQLDHVDPKEIIALLAVVRPVERGPGDLTVELDPGTRLSSLHPPELLLFAPEFGIMSIVERRAYRGVLPTSAGLQVAGGELFKARDARTDGLSLYLFSKSAVAKVVPAGGVSETRVVDTAAAVVVSWMSPN